MQYSDVRRRDLAIAAAAAVRCSDVRRGERLRHRIKHNGTRAVAVDGTQDYTTPMGRTAQGDPTLSGMKNTV